MSGETSKTVLDLPSHPGEPYSYFGTGAFVPPQLITAIETVEHRMVSGNFVDDSRRIFAVWRNSGIVAVNDLVAFTDTASAATASKVVIRDGSGDFAAHIITAALVGNASTATLAAAATVLATARAINGVNFDGSAAITVTAAAGTLSGATLAANVLASSLTSVGILSGLTVTATITGSITGNAGTATAFQTARTINGVSFDGTANITLPAGTSTSWAVARLLAGNSVDGSANVAFANKFIVQGTADSGLSAAQFLGALATGILKSTTTTGVLSVAVAGDFPTLNQSTTGSAATLTTARAINGINFDGSVAITVTAAAGTLTGATLAAGVTASSLTSLGTIAALVAGTITGSSTMAITGIATTVATFTGPAGNNSGSIKVIGNRTTYGNITGQFLTTAGGSTSADGITISTDSGFVSLSTGGQADALKLVHGGAATFASSVAMGALTATSMTITGKGGWNTGTDRILNIGGTLSTNNNSFGAVSSPTFDTAVTTLGAALYTSWGTAAAAFTLGAVYGLYVDDGGKGAGSSVTLQYGIYIAPQTQGATNWALYTTGAVNTGALTATQFRGTILDSNAASDLLLKRNGTTKVTVGASGVTFADTVLTDVVQSKTGTLTLTVSALIVLSPVSFLTGSKYLVIDGSGNVSVSTLGPIA